MLVYGKNVLKEIDEKKVRKAYTSRKDLINILKEKHIKFELTDNSRLDKMIKGNHQGIILDVLDFEYKTKEDINGDFIVILDHLQDPYNFGSIIRTSAAAGVKTIIISKDRQVLVNETVIKVSTGNIDKLNIVLVSNIKNTIDYLKNNNYFIYGADMHGKNYKEVDYNEKKVLVIGSEGEGISKIVKSSCDELIKIDMENNVESLNAGVSAGILMFNMRG